MTRFDESLPLFIETLRQHYKPAMLAKAAFVRDAGGRLSVFLPERISEVTQNKIDRAVRDRLGAYARPDKVLSDIDAPQTKQILEEAESVSPLSVNGLKIRLLDRRIVGADWLRNPEIKKPRKPRIVFASLKGGVGRSTALCVVAAHLSQRGRRVLAMDFDLEAPGIGTMLLKEEQLPMYGTLDYLVENGLSGIDRRFFASMYGDSTLGQRGGRVAVVPAIGRATLDNPADMLAKLARAYLEDFDKDGNPLTLADQLNEMVGRFERSGEFDVILIDVRAGLHEMAAPAILSLGAEILLFGLNQPQTYQGYNLLFSHLARFPNVRRDEWREKLAFVHAKASENSSDQFYVEQKFADLYALISDGLGGKLNDEPVDYYDEESDVVWRDEGAQIGDLSDNPVVLKILDDTRYRDFDPVQDKSLLSSKAYSTTFHDLLEYADIIAGLDEVE